VTLHLAALLDGRMVVRLKRGGVSDDGTPRDDEVLLSAAQARVLFTAVDAVRYGATSEPLPTGIKGYLWAVRVSDESTDDPLIFFFFTTHSRVNAVTLQDGVQRNLSLTEVQGRALDETFAAIAAQPAADSPSR
jgi:hypothetical protein